MRVVDLIRRKRDSGELTRDEIEELIAAYTRGDIADYQMSAWLMAVVLRGMTRPEIAALTEAMLHSGRVLDFSDLPGRKVDKHSTGGVGDKPSLVIAPIVAAGGVKVPMISGRGLGHSGGTLDKLESIPGFNVNLSLADFRRVLETCGCALIGQTAEIAPADKKIYALRDVTGKRMGKNVVALLTDMNQPLGRKAGNAMEVAESIEVLNGAGPADLRELCLELAAWMFFLGQRVKSVEEGKKLSSDLIASGHAREKFREIVGLQGGDVGVIDDPRRLAQARQTLDVTSPADGFIAETQCEQLGVACVVLGGGREKKDDTIDPAVGLEFHKRIGDAVERGEPLCTLHYNAEGRLEEARNLVETAYQIEQEKPKVVPPLIHRVIGA